MSRKTSYRQKLDRIRSLRKAEDTSLIPDASPSSSMPSGTSVSPPTPSVESKPAMPEIPKAFDSPTDMLPKPSISGGASVPEASIGTSNYSDKSSWGKMGSGFDSRGVADDMPKPAPVPDPMPEQKPLAGDSKGTGIEIGSVSDDKIKSGFDTAASAVKTGVGAVGSMFEPEKQESGVKNLKNELSGLDFRGAYNVRDHSDESLSYGLINQENPHGKYDGPNSQKVNMPINEFIAGPDGKRAVMAGFEGPDAQLAYRKINDYVNPPSFFDKLTRDEIKPYTREYREMNQKMDTPAGRRPDPMGSMSQFEPENLASGRESNLPAEKSAPTSVLSRLVPSIKTQNSLKKSEGVPMSGRITKVVEKIKEPHPKNLVTSGKDVDTRPLSPGATTKAAGPAPEASAAEKPNKPYKKDVAGTMKSMGSEEPCMKCDYRGRFNAALNKMTGSSMPTEGEPLAKPSVSQAQNRFVHAKAAEGEGWAKEWEKADEGRDVSKLPEKVEKTNQKMDDSPSAVDSAIQNAKINSVDSSYRNPMLPKLDFNPTPTPTPNTDQKLIEDARKPLPEPVQKGLNDYNRGELNEARSMFRTSLPKQSPQYKSAVQGVVNKMKARKAGEALTSHELETDFAQAQREGKKEFPRGTGAKAWQEPKPANKSELMEKGLKEHSRIIPKVKEIQQADHLSPDQKQSFIRRRYEISRDKNALAGRREAFADQNKFYEREKFGRLFPKGTGKADWKTKSPHEYFYEDVVDRHEIAGSDHYPDRTDIWYDPRITDGHEISSSYPQYKDHFEITPEPADQPAHYAHKFTFHHKPMKKPSESLKGGKADWKTKSPHEHFAEDVINRHETAGIDYHPDRMDVWYDPRITDGHEISSSYPQYKDHFEITPESADQPAHHAHKFTFHHKPMKKSSESLKGGKADGVPDSAIDPKTLKAGMKVEMEHTNSPKEAKEITKDHYVEIKKKAGTEAAKKYYPKLDQMEDELTKAVGPTKVSSGPLNKERIQALKEEYKALTDRVKKYHDKGTANQFNEVEEQIELPNQQKDGKGAIYSNQEPIVIQNEQPKDEDKIENPSKDDILDNETSAIAPAEKVEGKMELKGGNSIKAADGSKVSTSEPKSSWNKIANKLRPKEAKETSSMESEPMKKSKPVSNSTVAGTVEINGKKYNYRMQHGVKRITNGDLRGKYVHRVLKEQEMGRKLGENEEVHHKEHDRSKDGAKHTEVMDKGDHAAETNHNRARPNFRARYVHSRDGYHRSK